MAQVIHEGGHKNEKVGEVVSTKMAKTIIVEVARRVPHPLYKRIMNKRNAFTRTTKRARPIWAMWSRSSNAVPSAS